MTKFLRRHATLLIWFWFALLAILFTRPLIGRMTHEIAGEIGDNVYFIWMIGWWQKALFQTHSNPLDVRFLNYPEGWNMAHTEMAPAQLILAQPFSLLKGETFAYNMVMLLSFILSGVIMYGWVRHLTGSTLAGVLSGTIYACLPYRQAHYLIGHLNLSGTQWLPLFFWGWFDLMKEGTGEIRKKAALLAALGLGLTALTSQYYFFMLVIIAALMALFTILFRDRAKLRDPAFYKNCGLFICFALPMLAAAELPFLMLAGEGGMPDRDWGGVRMYSAGLTDYLLPATTHFLFGNFVGAHFNRDVWTEATLYVGVFSLALFIIGTCRKEQRSFLKWMFVSGILSAVILSMGTDLHWNGAPVEWTLPAFLQEKFGRETLPILLPGFFFFKYFPFFAKLRAMMRFGIIAECLIACGAGFGLIALFRKFPGKTALVTAVTLFLVIFEFFPKSQKAFAPVSARPVDHWLAEQPGEGSVMRIPFTLNDDQAGTYYTLTNEKPFIGGFFNAFPPNQYKRISGTMSGFPSKESLALARELQVEWVLIEENELDRAIAEGTVPWSSSAECFAAAESLGLKTEKRFGDISVYHIN